MLILNPKVPFLHNHHFALILNEREGQEGYLQSRLPMRMIFSVVFINLTLSVVSSNFLEASKVPVNGLLRTRNNFRDVTTLELY